MVLYYIHAYLITVLGNPQEVPGNPLGFLWVRQRERQGDDLLAICPLLSNHYMEKLTRLWTDKALDSDPLITSEASADLLMMATGCLQSQKVQGSKMSLLWYKKLSNKTL
jgi:hypothetical protein